MKTAAWVTFYDEVVAHAAVFYCCDFLILSSMTLATIMN